MDLKYPEAIVDCNWLYNRLDDDNIRIYDCTTWNLTAEQHGQMPYSQIISTILPLPLHCPWHPAQLFSRWAGVLKPPPSSGATIK